MSARIEIRLEITNLIKLDRRSASDPAIMFYVLEGQGWLPMGQTEVIQDAVNCAFVKSFEVSYRFEVDQRMKFVVVDVDSPSKPFDKQEYVGIVECSLGEALAARGGALSKEIINEKHRKRKNGVLNIIAEPLAASSYHFTFNVAGRKLDKKDTFGKSDPFLKILKMRPDGAASLVHSTEVIKNNLNPTWRPFKLSASALCNGDLNRPVVFEVYDWDKDGTHDFIGSFQASMNEMTSGIREREFINPRIRAKKSKYRNSGVLVINSLQMTKDVSFVDYIQGGCEVGLGFSIDFTGSNGNPKNPGSLHYLNPYSMNSYQHAITAVGGVVKWYDYDQRFPAWGFGARFGNDREASHLFPLNGNPRDPEVSGIEGVMTAYMNTLRHARLSGPTNFAPTIRAVSSLAASADRSQSRKQRYFILLIVTDGAITDIDLTVGAICEASRLPLSIIIIGVGQADFTKMDRLDADDGFLSIGNKRAVRDIVQFVPFERFKNDPARLARETLAEVPRQFMTYMKMRGISPIIRPQRPQYQGGIIRQPQPEQVAQGQQPLPSGAPQPSAAPPPQVQQPQPAGAVPHSGPLQPPAGGMPQWQQPQMQQMQQPYGMQPPPAGGMPQWQQPPMGGMPQWQQPPPNAYGYPPQPQWGGPPPSR